MMYTGTLMTETVFYPIFVGVALALVLALERPTLTRQAVLLAACLLAFLTRSQAIVLIPAVATAPLRARLARPPPSHPRRQGLPRHVRRARRRGRRRPRRRAGPRDARPFDVLGSYSVTGHADYHADQVLKWLLYHVSELDLYLGILPFAAVLLLVGLGRSLDRPLRVFLAAMVPLTVWLLLEVAAFASALSPRVQERNLFYVAPLFLIALLAWIERGMPRPASRGSGRCRRSGGAAGRAAVPPLIDTSAESDTLALLPLWWLQETGRQPRHRRRGRGRCSCGARRRLPHALAAVRARAAGARARSGSPSRRSGSSASTTASRRRPSAPCTRASRPRRATGSTRPSVATRTSLFSIPGAIRPSSR